MPLIAEIFRKRANELLQNVTDKERIDQDVFIVSALFCAVRIIKDARYFSGDTILKVERVNKPRKKYVQIFAK